VHATAQVVHFDTKAAREEQSWIRGTNAGLRGALRVLWAREVPPDFHARYSARARAYRYLLLNEPIAPAILGDKLGWYHRPLDLEPMRVASKSLLGEHDFSAFRDAECQSKSPVRTILEAEVRRAGNLFDFTFRANAFLHHMVRNLVGALVAVGAGKRAPEWIAEVLASRDRRLAAPTFPAAGLYLVGVEYDPAVGLPAFRRHPLIVTERP
jgi:tRNA pseudouridine38-40 synthase